MRQLKTFMRNRKAEMLWCGPCVCRTLQCWRYASENCWCGEGATEDMINSILNWFKNTSVYNDLSAEDKEQALADAQEILEWAWDGIAPFYNAVRQWRTFANYAEKMWLDVDESWPCDSSLYEDEEAFIIYISTAWAIHCKYLALVARRGRTPKKELINKDAISDYLDWVTTEEVTYQFKDWDDEILSFGSVKKWETPEAPIDLPPREGYRFTWWSPEVGKIEYDTTYVAQYVEDTPIPVTSISNIPESFRVNVGETTTLTFNYLPVDANDFTNIMVEDWADTYSDTHTSSTLSCNNWVGTITTTGTLEWFWEIGCRLNEDVDTIKGRVLPAGMGNVVAVEISGGWYGTVSINDWQEMDSNIIAYSPYPAWEFLLDWDVLEINSYGSYAESLRTYLHPHAGEGAEFVWWFYDPSGSYDEWAKVHNGDRIDEDRTIYACFERTS